MKVSYTFTEIQAVLSAMKAINAEVSFSAPNGKKWQESRKCKDLNATTLDMIAKQFKAIGYKITLTGVEFEVPSEQVVAVCRVIETKAKIIGRLIDAIASVCFLIGDVVKELDDAFKATFKSKKEEEKTEE